MNWLPAFGAWQFAIAGVAGAAATVLIHLLNRRRYQVLHWGAIEFLQQAIKKNRRVIQLRDAILLALRTLAVLLFGLALARPHYAPGDALAGPRPIHAIVIIDNSLSMSYQTLAGSLLNQAKQAAADLVERLPAGSHISILASCGDDSPSSQEPLIDAREARSVIEHIEAVDTSADIREILAKARVAAGSGSNHPKQFVLLTDGQNTPWANLPAAEDVSDIERLQIVDVAPQQRDNAWVANIEVRDGFAEARTQSTIRVTLARSGGNATRRAEVSLLVDGQLVGSRSVELQPGPSSQLVTFEHTFIANTTNDLAYIPIKVAMTPDRLPIDDVRHALVPVAPRLPIVFIDQYGADGEDPRRGQLGETRTLRRLLASDREDDLRDVVDGPRHITMRELDAETVEAARLVVVAGVRSPAEHVSLLRRFVAGGGQLLLAAGGEFSALDWQEHAWLDGNGILPAPLTGSIRGRSLRERAVENSVRGASGHVNPTLLSFDSLRDSRWLRLPDVSDASLSILYAEPLFFKWVEIDTTPDFASAYRVAARLESAEGPPLLVEREIERGRVLFFSTGITSTWNTLPTSNAVVMLDRLARELIRSTIADRDTMTGTAIQVELPISARDSTVVLQRPEHGVVAPLEPEYFDRERFGVTIRQAYRRGIYRLSAASADEQGVLSTANPVWQIELAVNGDRDESDLTAVDSARVAALGQRITVNLTHSADEVNLADTQTAAHGLWWWLALVVLCLVLAETLTLVVASRRRRSLLETEWAT